MCILSTLSALNSIENYCYHIEFRMDTWNIGTQGVSRITLVMWPTPPPPFYFSAPPLLKIRSRGYETAFSGTLSSGGLLHSDWLPPNRVIAHYHKVDLISTLLDALTVQNAPLSPGARHRLTLKMNDFRPLLFYLFIFYFFWELISSFFFIFFLFFLNITFKITFKRKKVHTKQ